MKHAQFTATLPRSTSFLLRHHRQRHQARQDRQAGCAAAGAGAIVTGKRERTRSWLGPPSPPSAAGWALQSTTRRPSWPASREPGWSGLTRRRSLVHFDPTLFDGTRRSRARRKPPWGRPPRDEGIRQDGGDRAGPVRFHGHRRAQPAGAARALGGGALTCGVDQDRIASMGFGETQPVADNGSSDGRRRNRRVDVMLRAKAV